MDTPPADKVLDELKAKHGLAGAPGYAAWWECGNCGTINPAPAIQTADNEVRCELCGILTAFGKVREKW